MTNHQSKPNNITMHPLIIVTLLFGTVICKPNQQQQRPDYDKQLLRKALDESNLPRVEVNSAPTNTSAVNFQCPEQFGYYTDTRDCTKYYVCVFGEVLHESCTGGLRFSRELQTCDWPRNVDCPQANANNGSSLTTPSTSAQNGANSPIGAGNTGVTSSSSFQTTIPTSTSSSGLLKQQPNAKEIESEGEERASLKSSSLVFADEGSDPQQPSFDEAVSPVITADGAIHLHDGSGGTYSLTPNHNRIQLQNQIQQQRQQEGQNVDVFVKPILTQPSNRARNNNQQQQQVSNNRQASSSKIQPATLPDQRVGSQQHRNSNNINQRQQQQQQQYQTTTPNSLPQTTTLHSVNQFSNNNNKQNEEPADSEMSSDDQANDSISAQADQESNDNQEPSSLESGDGDRQFISSSSSSSGGYIPPVTAPNTLRQVSASNRQSSQLLSINNRQQLDTRQSFKPILVTSSAPSTSTSQQQFQHNNDFNKQRSQQANAFSNSNFNPDVNVEDNDDRQDEDVRLNSRTNNQHQLNQMRQNQSNSALVSHHHQLQQAANTQNNRPSRMSSSFQQQFNQNPSNQLANVDNRQQLQHGNRFLPPDQTLSNNVNFNDSSKLIRLQASQFEPALLPESSGSFPQLPSPGSRSQSVLFSQQPFGFVADTNNNNNNNSPINGLQSAPQQQFEAGSGNSRNNVNNDSPSSHQSPSPALLPQQRRPRPPKRQQIPAGSQRRPVNQFRPTTNQLIEAPEPTTSTTSQPSTTNGFLSPHDASFMDQEEPTEAPPTRSQLSQLSRPIVAPTTVNFQQDVHSSTSFGPPTTFATTPSTTLTTVGARRFNDGQPVSSRNQFQNPNQGQRNAQLITSTEQPSNSLVTNSNLNLNTNSNPTTNQEQDPQLVNNRYLNPNIDVLDPGQPFGTVDYDFDILNDNSTDRRNPTGLAGNQQSSVSQQQQQQASSNTNNNQSSFNSNTNRQRQPTFSQEDEAENINLTNGQPNGGQIRLNLRPQQPVSRTRGSNNNVGGQGNRQQQQQVAATSAGSQFNQADSFALPPQVPPQQTTVSSSSSSSSSSNQQQSTKKPRPTNKKINVNHEQAIANNRASTEPAKRPEAHFATPHALQTATKCDNRVCRLPDCKCGDTLTPNGLDPKVIPQVVLLTFDDAVNDLNWEIYEELFTGRTNPNGCPILATFYVSHEWTDYGQVQTLYSRGHEMASHSITHSFGEKFSKSQWFKEVNGQREILNMYGGVKMNDVRGMRAPFLQIGGNKMFEMLYDANFTYDSSMPIFENSPPLWPYTLDYQLNHECMITPCPTKSYPGVWEVGMTMWVDLRGGRCSMGDACSNPSDEDGIYEMLMKNFNRHYKSNRAPFGLFYHSAWFNTVHHRRGFLRFMGTVNSLSDVFFVTNWQMLQWMRQPTPISEINSFEPWQCPAKNDRPPPCFHPSVCNVKSEHGTRFMKTCQPCPSNQQYPWVGTTGFKGKQAGLNGSG